MNEQQQAVYEGYAVVEIMGHNREIGYVRTEYFGGPALFRIDQPAIPAREYELKRAQWIDGVLAQPGTKMQREALPGKTAYVGPSAIFRMTPCDEATALEAIERMLPAPVKILSLVELKQIPATDHEERQEHLETCEEVDCATCKQFQAEIEDEQIPY